MRIYMRVTEDKYSLPLMVADSAKELAKMCGVSPHTVWYGCFRRQEPKKIKTYPKYACADIDDDDDWLDIMIDTIKENERGKK